MKKVSIILGLFIFINSSLVYSNVQNANSKKKVLIFTCHGGGGHISASNSMTEILKDKYEVVQVDPFIDSEIFGQNRFDFIKGVSFGYVNAIDFYNYLLRNRWNWVMNKLSDMGCWWVTKQEKKMVKVLSDYVDGKNVSMFISVSPFLNNVILTVAQNLNIPFLVVPTDLNTETFAFGMSSPTYKKFAFSLPFNDQLLIDKIKSVNIPKDSLKFVGYPIKKEFFQDKSKDKKKLKEEFNIPENKTVVMILMGSEGSRAIYQYVYNLARNKNKIHLIVCIGRNHHLKERIDLIRFKKNITYSVFGFTDRIRDLMESSDLLITKPGSSSLCEAIQLGIPLFIDQTGILLKWENINGDFLKKHKIGEVIKTYTKTNKLVNKFINDEKYRVSLKANFAKLKRIDFATPFKSLVDEMLKN